VPALTVCPSRHNDAWRRAEDAGQPHDLQPVYGSPTHCLGCQGRAYHQLTELPELLAAVWLEAVHGTTPKTVGTMGRRGLHPAWPGQASRLMTDRIVGGLVELEDDIREQRQLHHRPSRGSEGQTASGAVTFLLVHLEWALAEHPAAAEPYDRDSANPGSQIHHWHKAAMRFTRRDARIEQRNAPCKRCGWRSLFFADGEDYVECRNVECGALMTEAEYADWSKAIAEVHRSGQDPSGGLISAVAESAPEQAAA
jgi:hypothetical protein